MNSPKNGAARRGEGQAGSSEVPRKYDERTAVELPSVYHLPALSSSPQNAVDELLCQARERRRRCEAIAARHTVLARRHAAIERSLAALRGGSQ